MACHSQVAQVIWTRYFLLKKSISDIILVQFPSVNDVVESQNMVDFQRPSFSLDGDKYWCNLCGRKISQGMVFRFDIPIGLIFFVKSINPNYILHINIMKEMANKG